MDGDFSNETAPKRVIGRPWPKGVSGNPGGRPRNFYKEAILKKLPADEFAEIVAKACREGDSRIIAAMMDREYAKPEVAIKLEASGPDGAPLLAAVAVAPAPDTAERIAKALLSMGATLQPKRLNGGGNGHDDSGAGGS